MNALDVWWSLKTSRSDSVRRTSCLCSKHSLGLLEKSRLNLEISKMFAIRSVNLSEVQTIVHNRGLLGSWKEYGIHQKLWTLQSEFFRSCAIQLKLRQHVEWNDHVCVHLYPYSLALLRGAHKKIEGKNAGAGWFKGVLTTIK